MPSFIIHTIAGNRLINKLNLKEEDLFLLGNLLPDAVLTKEDKNLSEREQRLAIQKEKRNTHFRTVEGTIFEYPDIDLFLSKYKNLTKENIIVFGMFFHLYADYMYFKNFMLNHITALDDNYNILNVRKNVEYMKVNSTGKIFKHDVFWSKSNKDSLYNEYTRLNKYLLKDSKIDLDVNKMINYCKENKFDIDIKEIHINEGVQVLNKLNKLLKETEEEKSVELNIFDYKEIDKFIDYIVNSFIDEYKDILEVYNEKEKKKIKKMGN